MMFSRITTAALVMLITCAAPASDTPARDHRIAMVLQSADLSAKDLKTIHYIENAHGQLDEWADRLVARLERGLGPRQSDPMLDGRARFQIKKLRITYAGYTHSPELVEAINVLADAHERRLNALDTMLRYGVDQTRYRAVSAEVESVIRGIRSWRK
ncbi:MAG: hypothetical protein KJO55_03825 [Gammaproteobacteria bacterium]|nr:hypothetical protein [Gammaproteobacteria bacterium]